MSTVNDIFPNKTEFPSRHIGPRKTDVVAMLDLLGYKVRNKP
jgi:glycine dehydrogenase